MFKFILLGASILSMLVAMPASGETKDQPLVIPTHQGRVAALARSALSKELGIPPNLVEIVELRETTWPDSCLGLPSAQPCSGGPVRGVSIGLRVFGGTFEYRSDGNERLRFAGPGHKPSLPKPVELAREQLAIHLKLPAAQVAVVEVQEARWPDTCLGLPAPELCAPRETPGFTIVLRADGREYRYHSDRDEMLRFAGPGDLPRRDG